jgi:hypothetical protein
MDAETIVAEIEERADEFGINGRAEAFGQTVYLFAMPDEDEYRFDGIRPQLGFAVTTYEWENDMVDLDEKLAETRGWQAYFVSPSDGET